MCFWCKILLDFLVFCIGYKVVLLNWGIVGAKKKVIMVVLGAKEVKLESFEHYWYLAIRKFALNYWI